jgi:hypothetical protein
VDILIFAISSALAAEGSLKNRTTIESISTLLNGTRTKKGVYNITLLRILRSGFHLFDNLLPFRWTKSTIWLLTTKPNIFPLPSLEREIDSKVSVVNHTTI